ncbi:hypothetical protein [Pseudobutyrivibrio sp.]
MDTIDIIADRITSDCTSLQKTALTDKLNGKQDFHEDELLELDVRSDFVEGLSKYINKFTNRYLM